MLYECDYVQTKAIKAGSACHGTHHSQPTNPPIGAVITHSLASVRKGDAPFEVLSGDIQCIACSSPALGPTTCTHCAGLLIKEKKDFKAAKTLVLAFIAKEDPAHGRSSIKQRAGGAPPMPEIPAATEGAPLLLPPCLWS